MPRALWYPAAMTNYRTTRRGLLSGAGALALAGCSAEPASAGEAQYAGSPFREISDAEWRRRLGDASWRVLRHERTERAFSSPLVEEHRRGTFICRGCELPLFRSDWKFDSGTGWPSFDRVINANIGTKRDLVLLIPRTEYHCARCLGHQGHIFRGEGFTRRDIRYCNNGLALSFVAA